MNTVYHSNCMFLLVFMFNDRDIVFLHFNIFCKYNMGRLPFANTVSALRFVRQRPHIPLPAAYEGLWLQLLQRRQGSAYPPPRPFHGHSDHIQHFRNWNSVFARMCRSHILMKYVFVVFHWLGFLELKIYDCGQEYNLNMNYNPLNFDFNIYI